MTPTLSSRLATSFAAIICAGLLLIGARPTLAYDLYFTGTPAVSGQMFTLEPARGALTISGVTANCHLDSGETARPANIVLTIVLRRNGSAVNTRNISLATGWLFNKSTGIYFAPINQSFTLPTAGLMDYQMRSDDDYDFHLQLSADGTDSNPANNHATSSTFAYTVFSGDLIFNGEVTSLSSLSFSGSFYHIYPYYYPVLGPANASWDSPLGEFDFNAEGLAVRFDDQQYGYSTDLTVVHGDVPFSNISQAGIGGMTVQISSLSLTPAGVSTTPPTLYLPPGHTVHPIDTGVIMAGGRSFIEFSSGTYVGGALQVTMPALAFHGPNLPFYIKAAASSVDILNGSSLPLPSAQTEYVQAWALNALAADDSRLDSGLPANDTMFSRPGSASVSLNADGLSGAITFAGNQGDAYNGSVFFPRGQLTFASLTVNLADSIIGPGSELTSPVFSQKVGPGCPDSSCGDPLPENQRFTVASAGAGMLATGATGALFSALHGVDLQHDAPNLEWGFFTEAQDGHLHGSFIRNDKGEGVWVIPGFIMPAAADSGEDEVFRALNSSILFSDPATPESQHLLRTDNDDAAAQGNGFFAGLTMGPEFFTSGDAGVSALLANGLDIRFYGNDTYQFMSDQAQAKYVVRQGGVTGSFNTSFAGMATVYGYDLSFTRFGFKQDRNRIDQNTFIDGELTLHGMVGGATGMRVGFTNLDLACNGSLGSGLIDTEPEPNWPECTADDDNDGRENEGCHTLAYWQVPILMTGMAFVNDADDSGAACPNNPRLLQLQTMNSVKKLDKPLTMVASYPPDGSIKDQNLAGEVNNIIDRSSDQPEVNPGFALRLRRAYLNEPDNAPTSNEGFTVVSAQMDVPLFNDVEVMSHLANGNIFIFDDISAKDTDFDGLPEVGFTFNTDGELRALLTTEPYQFLPELHYFWPSTSLLDFSYQAQYNKSFALPGLPPSVARFTGLKKGINIFNVLTTNSVPDYVTPIDVKFSFGAGVDLDAMRAAFTEIGNQVAGLNDYLHDELGVDSGLDLEDMLSAIVEANKELNKIAGGDLGKYLTVELQTPLDEGNLNTLIGLGADSLAQVQQQAMELESYLKGPLLALQHEMEQSLLGLTSESQTLIDNDYAPVAYYGPEQLSTVNGAPGPGELTAAAAAVERFQVRLQETIRSGDEMVVTMANGLRSLCADESCGTGMPAEIIQRCDEADTKLENVRAELTTGYGAYLHNNAGNPIVAKINQAKGLHSAAVNAVNNFNIQAVMMTIRDAYGLAGVTPPNEQLSGFENWLMETKRRFSQGCATLEVGISMAESRVNEFYGNDAFTLLAKLTNGENNGLLDPQGEIRKKTALIKNVAEGLQGRIVYLRTTVPQRLEQIRPVLAMLQDLVDGDEQVPSGADWQTCLEMSQKRLDDAAKEFNQVFGKENIEDCGIDDNPGACFKAAFGPEAVDLARYVLDPLLNDLGDNGNDGLTKFFADLQQAVASALPLPSPEDLQKLIVTAILDSDFIKGLNEAFFSAFNPIKGELDNLSTQLTMQINQVISELTVALGKAWSEQLAEKIPFGCNPDEGPCRPNPLDMLSSASLSGYAIVSQDELSRLHLDSTMEIKPVPEKKISFYVAFDVSAWNAENGQGGCSEGVTGEFYDVTISTENVSADLLGTPVGIKHAHFGLTIAGNPAGLIPDELNPCTDSELPCAVPVGMFGGLYTLGEFGVDKMKLRDLGLEYGVGVAENFLAATGGGRFSSFNVPLAAFYAGRSCSTDVIKRVDKDVGNFINLPDGDPLEGIYVRGGAEIPLYSYECPFEVGAGLEVGGWVFATPFTYGGVLGGSLYGKVGCVGYLKGKVVTMLEPAAGKPKFSGTGWTAAGGGLCDPADWNSLEDIAKQAPLCVAAGAQFRVTYIDEFELSEPEFKTVPGGL